MVIMLVQLFILAVVTGLWLGIAFADALGKWERHPS